MRNDSARTAQQYIDALSDDRRKTIGDVRKVILKHLPKGYVESMGYGMICYFVPLERYPITYNKSPLVYISLAAQKNYNVIYLMGVYGDPENAKELKEGFVKAGKTLDMGKSCVRFHATNDLALDALGKAIAAVSVDQYIGIYEKSRLQTKTGLRKTARTSDGGEKTGDRKTAKKGTGSTVSAAKPTVKPRKSARKKTVPPR